MKVAIINAYYGEGSTGRIVSDIEKYLTNNNVECKVYCAYSNVVNKSIHLIGNKLDHKVHALLSRITGLQGYFSCMATKKFLRTLQEYDPDVVHIHNIHANFLNSRMLFDYLSKEKKKVVITLHDCFMYTGKCMHYTKARCERWKNGCGKCPKLREGNPSWFFDQTKKMLNDKRLFYSRLDDLCVIGVSNWITNEAKHSILSGKAKFTRIYNWIDSYEAGRVNLEDLQFWREIRNRKIVLCVATDWSESKGINDVYRLSELLEQEYVILLVGNKGNNKTRSNILFAGSINNKAILYELYKRATVLFHPSLEETFGLVIAESLMNGTPAITYDKTACPEIIGHDCGITIEASNIEGVYWAIKEIERNREIYALHCKERAMALFAKEKQLRKTLEVLMFK